MRSGFILLLALLLLAGAAWLRAPEYDEAYSIFLTAGDSRPAWPQGPFHPFEVRKFYEGVPGPEEIAQDLRKCDVHPPLYFWALEYWRRLFGPGWFAARMLSVLISVGALAALAWLATLAEIPPSRAMAFALLSYGFAYTGIVARGFALAQLLNITGVALILSATRSRRQTRGLALAAGLAFGAAAFSNYLAVFVGMAAFFWASLHWRRREILPPTALGFVIFLPWLLYFFFAQHNSRVGQFEKFSPTHAIALIAKDFGAACFGGLPVYAGNAGGLVTFCLAIFADICLAFVVKKWALNLSLFAFAVLFVPAGLFVLGLLFDSTPVEIRYLAFALPFTALLLAQTLPTALQFVFLGLEACGFLGLILAPSTMQPQGLAAGELATGQLDTQSPLVLLPFGNDGVGVPGPFIADAPDNLRLELVKPGLLPALSGEQNIILVPIRADDSSRQASNALLVMLNGDPCWKQQPSPPSTIAFTRTCETH